MDTYKLRIGEGTTLSFAKMGILQVDGLRRTPMRPEPEPSKEWIESGNPKEQSPEWTNAMTEWVRNTALEMDMRMLGLSYVLACKKTEENKAFEGALAEYGVNAKDYVFDLPGTPDQQYATGIFLWHSGDVLGFSKKLYLTEEEMKASYEHPLARALMWLDVESGNLVDAEVVAAFRKSLSTESKQRGDRDGIGGNIKGTKASQGRRK